MEPSPFPTFHRFDVLRQLGAGSMGVVYEAFDRKLGARVALKTLRDVDPSTIYRFKQEFRALQDLQHPNLVALGELIEDAGQWLFTMELIAGVDLYTWVRGDRPRDPATGATLAPADSTQLERPSLPRLPEAPEPPPAAASEPARPTAEGLGFDEARLRDALRQLALGLHALHGAGKVHRDIKPTNIMVAPDGRVVLLDFGLVAEARPTHASSDPALVGTIGYMSPEQAASLPLRPASDWYSLGCALYELLTGRLPHAGPPLQILLDKQRVEPSPPRVLVPAIPPDLDALCADLLCFDADARPTGPALLERLGVTPAAAARAATATTSSARPAPFLGRDPELAALRDAFTASRSGAPVTVFVRGESGLGKTDLAHHFANTLGRDDDALVLSGRCYERESVPFKAFDGVADALSRHLRHADPATTEALAPASLAWLPRVFPALGRVDAIARADAQSQELRDPLELRNRVFTGVRELLRRLGSRRPLVLLIDDLQWADHDSLLLLRELLRGPDAPHLLLVATTRADAPSDTGAAGLPGDVRNIRLCPLPPAVARALSGLLLSRAGLDAPALADAIAAESGGHPLHIDALVRHAALSGSAREGRLRLNDAIWARAVDVGPTARDLLALICLASAPLPLTVFAAAAAIDPAEFTRTLGALRVSHFVRSSRRDAESLEPYHDRVREAILERLDPEVARRGHGRLAGALAATPMGQEQPELLVSHCLAAGLRAEAAGYAEAAARRATAALAFDRAAEQYERALALTSHTPERRRELVHARAQALFFAGRLPEAAELYLAAAHGAAPRERLALQQRASESYLTAGHLERGLAVLDDVRRETGVPFPRTNTGALASLLWIRGRLRLRGLRWRERHESRIPAADLMRWDVYRAAALSLAIVDNVRAQTFQSRGLLHALRMGERSRALKSLLYEASFICSFGGRALERAARILGEVAPLAATAGDPVLRALVHTSQGIQAYFSTRFPEASRELGQAERILVTETTGEWGELNVVRTIRLLTLHRSGAFAELGRDALHFLADAERRGDTYTATSLRRQCAQVWLAEDRPDEARAQLARATWVPAGGQFHIQHYWELVAEADIALYCGRGAASLPSLLPRFDAVWASLVPRAVQMAKLEAHSLLGRLHLSAASGRDTHRHLAMAARAVKRIRRDRTGFGDVWADLLDAGVRHRQGDHPGAAAVLRAAIERADAFDLRHCAAAARTRLAGLVDEAEAAPLRAGAAAYAEAEGVRRLEGLVNMLAPGF